MTSLAMCDDVAQLTQRYLDYIDQVEALTLPRLQPERLDDLLDEIDRRLMPEAFGRGVAWTCSVEGPIRVVLTDRTLILEALLEWASLAVETSSPGDSVSLVVTAEEAPLIPERVCLTLSSSAEELITDLTNLSEDPLFNRHVCLEEVGSDPGSRLALSMERLEMIGVVTRMDLADQGLIRTVHFLLPVVQPARS